MTESEKLETAEACLNDITKIVNSDNNRETMITDIGLVLGFWKACNSGQVVDAGKDK